jgi:hypothetical protein
VNASSQYCTSCGKQSPGGSRFCNSCGAALSRSTTPAPPPPQASPPPYVPQAQPVLAQTQQPGPLAWLKRQSTLVKVLMGVGILVVIGVIAGAAIAGSGKSNKTVAIVNTTTSTLATTTTAQPTTTLPPTTTTTESEAAFKARCEKVAYKVLSKNPDSLTTNAYYLKGKIFQIMEDSGETFMLVSVTNEGYGFWDDNVAVTYLGTVDVYEDDIVKIWGVCTGSYSYTSTAGYELTVPGILAGYVEKSK